jgi:hypothetical protein
MMSPKKRKAVMAATFRGKSMRPGGGGRFAQMVASGVPPGAAAAAGRKKYGKEQIGKWSAAGRRRAAR